MSPWAFLLRLLAHENSKANATITTCSVPGSTNNLSDFLFHLPNSALLDMLNTWAPFSHAGSL
jgi:hypothetical protein